jgi:hypothetical protein
VGDGDSGKGSRVSLSPSNLGHDFYWLGIPQSCSLGLGVWGLSREVVEGIWGPFSSMPRIWDPGARSPPPPVSGPGGAVTQGLDKPAQLQGGPLPPSVPKLSPASATQPLPHPLAWLGEPALEGSVLEREEGHKWDM